MTVWFLIFCHWMRLAKINGQRFRSCWGLTQSCFALITIMRQPFRGFRMKFILTSLFHPRLPAASTSWRQYWITLNLNQGLWLWQLMKSILSSIEVPVSGRATQCYGLFSKWLVIGLGLVAAWCLIEKLLKSFRTSMHLKIISISFRSALINLKLLLFKKLSSSKKRSHITAYTF